MAQFREIPPSELSDNPFTLIGEDWMAVTAAAKGRVNTMTASWGGVGILWGLPVATVAYDGETPYFSEARLVLFCRKLYRQEMKPESFVDTALVRQWYPERDYHIMYVGAVEKILRRE